MTPLDLLHKSMVEHPDDDLARLRFHECLADTDLVLLLEAEPIDDRISPKLADLGGQTCVLVFDNENRLADFAQKPAPYAALPGRELVQMLAGQGMGIALNPGVAPSSFVVATDVVDWMAGALANAPVEQEDLPTAFQMPEDLDQDLMLALERRLISVSGMATHACLVQATYDSGRKALLLAFFGADSAAEAVLTEAANGAVSFRAREIALDVTFLEPGSALCAMIEKTGLRFDIPEPQAAPMAGAAPGMDPDKPPRIR